jgi:hypothetical protein
MFTTRLGQGIYDAKQVRELRWDGQIRLLAETLSKAEFVEKLAKDRLIDPAVGNVVWMSIKQS